MSERYDLDPSETREWLDAVEDVIDRDGTERAHFLLDRAVAAARANGATLPFGATTSYVNTIPPDQQPEFPGDMSMEWRIRTINRWNAMATVVRRNKESSEYGGHIASFASSAVLYDIGLNHFWRARTRETGGGDLVFFQGHAIPGIYARSFMEGRIDASRLDNFRAETDGEGLSSYPHPWLMPDYWQFPTVSMGLGPLMAIYQARFMKYMHNRGHIDMGDRKVWAFLGDGEMDEPESMGAIGVAAREELDNLIFVINCNLQRLDGPVRGNSKIIQELEGEFRGSGWNVIKVIWGSGWDVLLEKDESGRLRQLMDETVDGDYQTFRSRSGAYIREHFFGKYPETAALVEDWSDADIWALRRGGHDPIKVFAAYDRAVKTKGQPTVILVKTVKGYGMGEAGEGQNITHQQKKMAEDQLRAFRDRFDVPVPPEEIGKAPYVTLGNEQKAYMLERREKLGGPFPVRDARCPQLELPGLDAFDAVLKDTGERQISTTMAFVRVLNTLCRDKQIGKFVVPIVPDESRTFGMEGMFRQLGIYNPKGQLYTPEDADQLSYYKESKSGQVLQEGINEAGAMADWIAAATSYSVHGVPMIPFYIYYSMFGFQRIGDLTWAAGDSRARGFLLGGTAGRTTLNGEGLQHQDGHSHILAGTIPNCISYDPTFGYEIAVIVQDGLRRMFVDNEDVYYYLTLENENYHHPALPEGAEEGVIKGLYRFERAEPNGERHVNLLGCGSIFRQAMMARDMLKADFGVSADLWCATSLNELAREAQDVERENRMNPTAEPKAAYVTRVLGEAQGPVIAATDYMKNFVEQIRAFVPQPLHVLGTDGFGRSDSRVRLRRHFEVDANHIAATAVYALHKEGKVDADVVRQAYQRYEIDPNKANPRTA
jgi:pyruvate dehydrogenase E1 component